MSKAMIDLLERQLDVLGKAGPLGVVQAARDVVNVAAAIVRDQENRIERLERRIDVTAPPL